MLRLSMIRNQLDSAAAPAGNAAVFRGVQLSFCTPPQGRRVLRFGLNQFIHELSLCARAIKDAAWANLILVLQRQH